MNTLANVQRQFTECADVSFLLPVDAAKWPIREDD